MENLEVIKVSDLIEDDLNANKGSDSGAELLLNSLSQYGAGRSVLLDKNRRLIGGNKTKRQALKAGINEVIVVKTDGKKLVIVQREDLDLDSAEGRSLAILDNRVSEKNLVWDTENLAEIQDRFSVDLKEHWNAKELQAMMESFVDESGVDSNLKTGYNKNTIRQIVVYFLEKDHKRVIEQLEEIGKDFDIIDDNSEVFLKLIDFYLQNKVEQ